MAHRSLQTSDSSDVGVLVIDGGEVRASAKLHRRVEGVVDFPKENQGKMEEPTDLIDESSF